MGILPGLPRLTILFIILRILDYVRVEYIQMKSKSVHTAKEHYQVFGLEELAFITYHLQQ
jgi:hypothetical protein